MGHFEDRQRALGDIYELRTLAENPDADTSSDARLAAWAAVAQAQTMLVFSDTIKQATETVLGDIIPQLRATLGDR